MFEVIMEKLQGLAKKYGILPGMNLINIDSLERVEFFADVEDYLEVDLNEYYLDFIDKPIEALAMVITEIKRKQL